MVHPYRYFNVQCALICLEKAQFHAHFNHDHRTFCCTFCSLRFSLQSELDEHITEKHPKVTRADTANTAIVHPQQGQPSVQAPLVPAPQVPAPLAPAPTPSLPEPIPEPPADTTGDQTNRQDTSTLSEPTLDTTGTFGHIQTPPRAA